MVIQVMKSEAVLQVTDTDHSDTTSEMSDEGYRSLGIVHDKTKQRSSLYSQNSAEDAEDNGKWKFRVWLDKFCGWVMTANCFRASGVHRRRPQRFRTKKNAILSEDLRKRSQDQAGEEPAVHGETDGERPAFLEGERKILMQPEFLRRSGI